MSLSITTEPAPLTVNADGVVLVSETRVPLDTVVFEFKQGVTPEKIIEQYTSLKLADVYAVISYYLRHEDEVEAYLWQRQKMAEEVRQENERRFPSAGLRDRLLARRQARKELVD